MSRRILALVLVVVALAGASGCADDVSPAARVGDATVSNDDFLEEVEQWAGNPMAVDPSQVAGLAPGNLPGELVRQLLRQRVDFMIHEQEFDRLGLELDESRRNDALTALFGDPAQAEEAFGSFSDDFAASFTDDVARQVALQEELGQQGYSEWYVEAYESAEVEVNSRYGSWDPATRSIVAPPTAAEAAAG